MPPEVREISGLIALVSTALIGTTVFLLRIAWQGMTNSYFKLTPLERREIGRFTWWVTLFYLLILFIAAVVGVSNPQLVPGVTILVIIVIETVALMIIFGFWMIKKIRGSKKEQQRPKKSDMSSSFYFMSLSFLSWSIFFDIFALIGISATMLDIQITPNWLDNYNWGRWFLLNGISLFCIGVATLGYASLNYNWQRELDSNKTGV